MAELDPRRPCEIAHDDQSQAAADEILDFLAALEPRILTWQRAGAWTKLRISMFLQRARASTDTSFRVCTHAREPAFHESPRPLVLDTQRGILACRAGCYLACVRAQGDGRWSDGGVCFACGGPVEGAVWHDLYIAYGPILALGTLCAQCRQSSSGPLPRVVES